MRNIPHKYRCVEMLSGEIKKIMAEHVCSVIETHQKCRAEITPELLKKFFNRNRNFDRSHSVREPVQLETDETYATYGVDFDHYFGARPSAEEMIIESDNNRITGNL